MKKLPLGVGIITLLLVAVACAMPATETNRSSGLPPPLHESGSISSDQLAESHRMNGQVVWGCDSLWRKCGVDVGTGGQHVLSTFASGMNQTEGELVNATHFYRTRPPSNVTFSDVWAYEYQTESPKILGMTPTETALSIGLAGVITIVAWKNIGGKGGEARELSAAERAAQESRMAEEAANAMRISDDAIRAAMKTPDDFARAVSEWEKTGIITGEQATSARHIVQDGGKVEDVFAEVKKVLQVSEKIPPAAANLAKVGASGAAKKPGLWIFELSQYGRLTPNEIQELGDGALMFGYTKAPDSFELVKTFRIGFGPFKFERITRESGQFGGYQFFRMDGLNELAAIRKSNEAILAATGRIEATLATHGEKLDSLAKELGMTREALLAKMEQSIAEGRSLSEFVEKVGNSQARANTEIMDALGQIYDDLGKKEVALSEGQVVRSRAIDGARTAVGNAALTDARIPEEIMVSARDDTGAMLGQALLKKKKPILQPVNVNDWIGPFSPN